MTTEPRPLPTPGPWRVCHHDSTAITVRGADDMPVAEMWKTGLRNDEANAALIARAPELLARVAELEKQHDDLAELFDEREELLTAVRTELATLQATHQRNVELLAHATEKAVELTTENARLRELLRECKEQLRDWLCDVDMNTDPRLSWYDAQICKSNVADTNTILAKIDGELSQ